MPKAPDGYRPLLNRGSSGSLWLAEDHLLIIENTRFLLCIRETYRRLDFSNIRAILHAPSSRGAWLVALFLIILAISAGIVAMSGLDSGPALISGGLMAMAGLLGLSAHFFKGPTRSLTIQTTVHPWRIKVATRKKHIDTIIAALEPLCLEAQKGVPMGQAAVPAPGATTPPLPNLPFLHTDTPQPPQGTHPLALPAWLCLLAFAAMIAGELIWNSRPATLLMMGFACAALVLLMISCTRGGGTLATGGRGVFIFGLTMLGISMAAGYSAAMTGVMQASLRGDDSDRGSEEAIVRALAEFPEGSPDGLSTAGMAIATLTALSAVAGLLATLHRNKLHRTSQQAATPTPP